MSGQLDDETRRAPARVDALFYSNEFSDPQCDSPLSPIGMRRNILGINVREGGYHIP